MSETLTLEEVKKQINNLLWTTLPGNIKIADAEKCAVEMFKSYENCLKTIPICNDG